MILSSSLKLVPNRLISSGRSETGCEMRFSIDLTLWSDFVIVIYSTSSIAIFFIFFSLITCRIKSFVEILGFLIDNAKSMVFSSSKSISFLKVMLFIPDCKKNCTIGVIFAIETGSFPIYSLSFINILLSTSDIVRIVSSCKTCFRTENNSFICFSTNGLLTG